MSRPRMLRSLVSATVLSAIVSLIATAVAFAGESGIPFPK